MPCTQPKNINRARPTENLRSSKNSPFVLGERESLPSIDDNLRIWRHDEVLVLRGRRQNRRCIIRGKQRARIFDGFFKRKVWNEQKNWYVPLLFTCISTKCVGFNPISTILSDQVGKIPLKVPKIVTEPVKRRLSEMLLRQSYEFIWNWLRFFIVYPNRPFSGILDRGPHAPSPTTT